MDAGTHKRPADGGGGARPARRAARVALRHGVHRARRGAPPPAGAAGARRGAALPAGGGGDILLRPRAGAARQGHRRGRPHDQLPHGRLRARAHREGPARHDRQGPRSAPVLEAMRAHGAVYLAATGGAGALLASCVESCELVAWPDLGAEAVRRLTLRDMPLTVAADAAGGDLYVSGPAAWREGAAKAKIKGDFHGNER